MRDEKAIEWRKRTGIEPAELPVKEAPSILKTEPRTSRERASARLCNIHIVADQGAHYLVSGIVQGVGFRYWTERIARELELTGWVRNLIDGRVEVLAEGSPEKLRELEASLWRGPRSAEVSAVEVRSVSVEGRSSFEIRRDGDQPAWT